MSRFRAALRRAARDLDVPRPVRAAILLELASDLDAAYDDLRRRGVDEVEAERRAETMILGSGEMVRRLGRMHSGAWCHWSRGVGERLTSPGGLVLLAIAVLPVLAVAAAQAAPWFTAGPEGVFASPGGSLSRTLPWLVISAGAGAALVAVREAARLAVARLPTGSGPDLLLLLSVLAPALGLLALSLGLQGIAEGMATGSGLGALAQEPSDAALQSAAFGRLARDGALLAAGLVVGITGALSWFAIVSRASILIAREADALLDGDPPTEIIGRSAGIPLVRRRKA